MQKVHFETTPTDQSKEYAKLIDVILVILNRVSVELALESQRNHSLESGPIYLLERGLAA